MVTPLDLQKFPRSQILTIAKIAEMSERFDDVAKVTKQLWTRVKDDGGFLPEERDLFIVGYKNAIGRRRASAKKIKTLLMSGQRSATDREDLLEFYLNIIQREIIALCNEVLAVVDEYLHATEDDLLSRAIFLKTKADYYRYMAEVKRGTDNQHCVDIATATYEEVHQLVSTHLCPTDPVFLGIALNYSVFLHEHLKNPTEAIRIAQKTFDDAVAELDAVSESQHRDAAFILKIMRENLEFWRAKSTRKIP
ncbi:14-3-3 protein gamma-like [Galendromus occidentalis]|uniref:14-3-3 protein gamma-like n=1 Tax=Galendromus occidentalis TaxID=34638 RepID=A0AAJ6QYL1_9ACAR|nr:14-3-3 protein gamma-like [Galendromus occidentalis]